MPRNHTPRLNMEHAVYLVFKCRKCGRPSFLNIADGRMMHAERVSDALIVDSTRPPVVDKPAGK